MKFPPHIVVFGDQDWRGDCPSETAEQATFFNKLRKEHPEYSAIALHIKNEGKRDFRQVNAMKLEGGFVAGACDIVIPGSPTFVCELKRKDHTKSTWQKGQQDYMKAAMDAGAFVCVALGWQAAYEAFLEWKDSN